MTNILNVILCLLIVGVSLLLWTVGVPRGQEGPLVFATSIVGLVCLCVILYIVINHSYNPPLWFLRAKLYVTQFRIVRTINDKPHTDQWRISIQQKVLFGKWKEIAHFDPRTTYHGGDMMDNLVVAEAYVFNTCKTMYAAAHSNNKVIVQGTVNQFVKGVV